MAYKRTPRYAPGQALMACSICGFPYLFPEELVFADDKLFYCLRTCWLGQTALTDTRERSYSNRRRDNDNPPIRGIRPSWRT
jgi:hypothetical protein